MPSLQINKLRHREVKWLNESHVPSKRQSMDLNSGHLVPEFLIVMSIMYCVVSPRDQKLKGLWLTLYDWDGEKSCDDPALPQMIYFIFFWTKWHTKIQRPDYRFFKVPHRTVSWANIIIASLLVHSDRWLLQRAWGQIFASKYFTLKLLDLLPPWM